MSTEFATFIKSYTGGIVSDKSTVKVRLSSPVAGAVPGNELKDGTLSFSPSVRGTARWSAPDEVEFIPDADALKPGQAYTARFRLDRVMKVKRRFSRFTFRFLVREKEAEIRPGDLTITASAPDKASVDGMICFTESVPVEKVKEMFSFDYPADSVEVDIVPGDGSGSRFSILPGARRTGNSNYRFLLPERLSGPRRLPLSPYLQREVSQ